MLDAPSRFIRSVQLLPEFIEDPTRYPFTVPAIKHLTTLELHPQVTFFVGENGTGKSTLLEAIAVAAGFNAEGGTKNFRFATNDEVHPLRSCLRLVRGTTRESTGFFLRAESFFNVATEIDRLGAAQSYGGRSLHEQSHGESFMALVNHRFSEHGLYLLDEPGSSRSSSPSTNWRASRTASSSSPRTRPSSSRTHTPSGTPSPTTPSPRSPTKRRSTSGSPATSSPAQGGTSRGCSRTTRRPRLRLDPAGRSEGPSAALTARDDTGTLARAPEVEHESPP
jgi:predicted ATPase